MLRLLGEHQGDKGSGNPSWRRVYPWTEVEKGNGDSMWKGREARKDRAPCGDLQELKWLATAWMCQEVDLDLTLRLAHDPITCAGSWSLGVAESSAGLEAQGQGQDVAVLQIGLSAGLSSVGGDGEEARLPMKGK